MGRRSRQRGIQKKTNGAEMCDTTNNDKANDDDNDENMDHIVHA